MKSDDSGVMIALLVAGGGYLAYSQGWLSFLGIGAPAASTAASSAAGTSTASADASTQAAAAQAAAALAAAQAQSLLNQAATQKAAADAQAAAALTQAQDAADIARRRFVRNTGVALPPVIPAPQLDPNRVTATPVGSFSGYRGIGTYRLRGR